MEQILNNQKPICVICGRSKEEVIAEERGDLREHKIDSSWKSVLIDDECFAELENSCEE